MPDGQLALTIDPAQGQRYQGIVDLDGENLSECFTNYFVMSQQVGTRFWLNADGQRARGLLLQRCRPTARRTRTTAKTAGSTSRPWPTR